MQECQRNGECSLCENGVIIEQRRWSSLSGIVSTFKLRCFADLQG